MEKMLEKLKGGLIVSCYAGPDFNAEMGVPQTMVCVAKSCIAGGARAIRTNWENVAAVKAAVDVPVIGLGGITTGADALEFIMAGAAAVQVGTANFMDPRAGGRITAEIGQWMDRHGVKNLDEIRGCARG